MCDLQRSHARLDRLIAEYSRHSIPDPFEAWALDAAKQRQALLDRVATILAHLPELTEQIVHSDLASHYPKVGGSNPPPGTVRRCVSGVVRSHPDWGRSSGSCLVAATLGTHASNVRFMLDVSEGKTAKNRPHVDLGTGDLAAERSRVLGLGAEHVGDYDEYGITWSSYRDPEGNEFCIGLHEPPSL
jgi:hypothetical protein